MRKTPKISQFFWPDDLDPQIALLLDEGCRPDDPEIVRQLIEEPSDVDEDSREVGYQPAFLQDKTHVGPRKLTAKEMPSSKEVADFYAKHPKLRPGKYEDVPNGFRTEKGFRVTTSRPSSFEPDPRMEVPEWASDERAVLRRLAQAPRPSPAGEWRHPSRPDAKHA